MSAASVEPSSSSSNISASRGLLLQQIGKRLSVDWCRIAFGQIARFKPVGFPRRASLPYGVVLTTFLTSHGVPNLPGEHIDHSTALVRPINANSLVLSAAHAAPFSDNEDASQDAEGEVAGADTPVVHARRPRIDAFLNF